MVPAVKLHIENSERENSFSFLNLDINNVFNKEINFPVFINDPVAYGDVSVQCFIFPPLSDFLPSLKDLLGNPVFFLYLCGSVFQFNSLVGMVTYKPKYIEQQYGQTSTQTNLIIGKSITMPNVQ